MQFDHAKDYTLCPKTYVSFTNCTFNTVGEFTLVKNSSKNEEVWVRTVGSIETGEKFLAKVDAGPGKFYVDSDLTGLKKNSQ